MDKVLVASDTAEEQDKLLEKVLGVLEKNRVTVNWKNSLIRKHNIPFLGHEFGPDGVRPDDDKVAAIVEMGPPTSVSQLLQFLGMVNYLGVYLPDLHKVLKPLNDLLRSDVTFQWGPAQDDSFNQVKGLLMSEPVLAYYDMIKPTLISADASSNCVSKSISSISGVFSQEVVSSRCRLVINAVSHSSISILY